MCNFLRSKLLFLYFCFAMFNVATLNIHAQVGFTYRASLTYGNNDMSDVWGFVYNNREYAIATVDNGVSIVDVQNPDMPTEVFWVDGPNTFWRDAKVWGNYAYITNEANGGLQIIDFSALPNAIVQSDVYYWTGGDFQGNTVSFSSAHNVFIDENGILYIVGANYGVGGAIMLDLNADPVNPPIVGIYNERYVHDCFVRDNVFWSAEINDGIFSVVDVSDKVNPLVLATQTTTSTFTHNLWLSDDGNYLFTTDEVSNANIDAYDVSDLSDIQRIDTYKSNPGNNVIPHNCFVLGNLLYISYYRDGVVVVDISQPQNMIEVGNYDTSPSFSGNGFNGCWGVYPYLPSGTILATDIEEGLIVLSPNIQQACFLEGSISDATNSTPIIDAVIEIVSNGDANTTSDFSGNYATGLAQAGTYTVLVSASGYESESFTINLNNGTTQVLNVSLTPAVPFTINGQVQALNTGFPIANAQVLISSTTDTYLLNTDNMGNFSTVVAGPGTFNLVAGQWGYVTELVDNQVFDDSNNAITIPLESGYYDDFVFDFGWTINGNASAGIWERDVPNGTSFDSNASNAGSDIVNDIGNVAYVTGNAAGGGAGNDDVDNGSTMLTSPVFDLSAYDDAEISYYRWFYNDSGNSEPNDEMIIYLTNGSETLPIEIIANDDPFESEWKQTNIIVSDYMATSANMQLIADIGDLGGGHLVEGGIDGFRAMGITPTPTFTVNGTVIDNDTGQAIPLAQVLVTNGTTPQWLTTDMMGQFSVTVVENSVYDFYAGQWAWVSNGLFNQVFMANATLTIPLTAGYYDDFLFDFGWTVTGDANTGNWEWDVPNATYYNGVPSNVEVDIDSDLGNRAYVTGNAAGGVGNDDVDNGSTILTSPVFDLSAYSNAQISYFRWFYNDGGNGSPDDEMVIYLTNGNETVAIETIIDGDDFESAWQQTSIMVSDYLTPTANMQLIANIGDLGDGHLLEGGIDGFLVDALTPLQQGIIVQARVLLEGAYIGNNEMHTSLQSTNTLPLEQPYANAPYNYMGNESVTAATNIPPNSTDWVLLELREANNSNNIVETRAAFVNSNGFLQDTDALLGVRFYNLIEGENYYLLIRHRNHLDVLSSMPISLPNTTPFDFTNPANVLGGATQLALFNDGNSGLLAGDFDSNGVITVEDFNYFTTQAAQIAQYLNADLNLDTNVTVNDFNIYLPNTSIIGVSQVRY